MYKCLPWHPLRLVMPLKSEGYKNNCKEIYALDNLILKLIECTLEFHLLFRAENECLRTRNS